MNNDKKQNHCICVANLSPEELDALMQEISIRLGTVHQAAEPEHPDNVDPTDQNHPTSKMEGDGEEVFGQMLDDLLYAATMLDALYGIMIALSDSRVCKRLALARGAELVKEADSILEKWQRYSEPVV